ncbi:MAG: ABC transporter permease, partial [Bacteroidales bacterium]|nr:ABC transporter permease [Bacteroidales bacterium]
QQATISTYCDMSSFMYYRAMILASNYVVLDMNNRIKVERLNAQGVTGEAALTVSNPVRFDDVILYNEGAGFASFLMPALLIIMIHQILFFGIGMLAGTAREENRFHKLVSPGLTRKGGTYRIIIGKSAAYFLLFLAWSVYIIGFTPHFFNLPHIGNPITILEFIIPFLLATIFFSMTISVFLPNRETGMVIFLFFSLILLFLSGISWPESNMNGFWKVFAWIFPSTHGVQGYLKINSMGAEISQITREIITLWIQTAIYFATTVTVYYWQMKRSSSQSAKMAREKAIAMEG